MSSFTKRYTGIVDKLISKVEVRKGGLSFRCNALWDTGATHTCISKTLVTMLSLVPTAYVVVKNAGGSSNTGKYLVDNITLPNKVIINDVEVCEVAIGDQGFDILIGMDIITHGDFLVSNNKRTVFSFRSPSEETIDFVQQDVCKNFTGRKNNKW